MTGTTTGSRSAGVGTRPGADGNESVAEQAQSAVSTAAEKAKETGSELTHMASDQVGSAAHRLAGRADERKGELASQARTIQEKLDEFATSIAGDQPKVGEVVHTAAERAGRFIDYVEQTPVEDMTQELRTQMRRHPMIFAAGMFGVGFALSRVVKPVDTASLQASSTGGSRQLTSGTGAGGFNPNRDAAPTQALPAASPVDGGMH